MCSAHVMELLGPHMGDPRVLVRSTLPLWLVALRSRVCTRAGCKKVFIKQTNNLSFARQATCIAPMLRGLLAGADGPADIQRWCELASCYLEVSPFARVLGYSRSCPSTVAASF